MGEELAVRYRFALEEILLCLLGGQAGTAEHLAALALDLREEYLDPGFMREHLGIHPSHLPTHLQHLGMRTP